MKRTFFPTVVFALLLISALNASAQTEVLIYPQPDSPLQLSNALSKWQPSVDNEGREWKILTVEFISQNVRDKAIRAFTIRQFSGEFDSDIGSTIFAYTLTPTGMFGSNLPNQEEIGGRGFLKLPESIRIAVDFIEFTDGSIWGKDLSNSAQQLAGVKAGVKAALEYLKGINRQNGIEAVIKMIDQVKELQPPDDKSEIWKRGFRSGISSIKNRIKRAYENEGTKAAEAAFQKSFDIFSSN